MSVDEAWQGERVAVGLLCLLLIPLGLGIGHLLLTLWLGLSLYLLWHLFQLVRFSRWLSRPKQYPRPYPIGIWGAVLPQVDQLAGRGQKRKRKLNRMLSGFLESTGALPDATLVLNDEGRLEWWNGVAAQLLGIDRKRDKGGLIDDLISDPVFLDYLHSGHYQRPLQIPRRSMIGSVWRSGSYPTARANACSRRGTSAGSTSWRRCAAILWPTYPMRSEPR